jgi:hypothetical protein
MTCHIQLHNIISTTLRTLALLIMMHGAEQGEWGTIARVRSVYTLKYSQRAFFHLNARQSTMHLAPLSLSASAAAAVIYCHIRAEAMVRLPWIARKEE